MSKSKDQKRSEKPQVTKQERVTRAIRKLSRNLLIDLLDDAVGVGCRDEDDKDSLRSEVSRLHAAGKISADEILELA